MKHLRIFEEYSPEKRELVKDYKGYEIYDRGGYIVVAKPGDHWTHDFIIDLDDSKMDGNRKSIGMSYEEQLESAERYIDWLTRGK